MHISSWRKLLNILLKNNILILFILLSLQVFTGTSPIIVAWLNGKLIDVIANNALGSHIIPAAITMIVVTCSLLIALGDLFTVLQNFSSDAFKDLIYHRIQSHLIKSIAEYPNNSLFEDPKTASLVELAKQNASNISEYLSTASQVLVMVFSFITATFLGFTIAWWLPFLLLITMGPFIYFRTKIENHLWGVKEHYGSTIIKLNIYERILTTPEFSKEIRLYKAQGLILAKWHILYKSFLAELNRTRFIGSFKIACWAFISAIGPLLAFWYVAMNTVHGHLSLGKLSFLLGIILQLKGSLLCLMYNTADIIRAFLSSKPLRSLLSLEPPRLNNPTYFSHHTVPPLLVLENVSFSYSQSSRLVINKLNLNIEKDKSYAIVGENGSGKSTLLKLICRFYQPISGKIYWQGQDINSLDFNTYRADIATLFQDFARFPLTVVRDNIAIGSSISDDLIIRALQQVELNFLATKLDDTLYKGLENSLDLSGGQWQRLALARLIANLKDKQLVMFDEPTAALDPHVEHKILTLISTIMAKHTSIIISHRLSTCKLVDSIIVLQAGMIAEAGSHKQLLKSNGIYSTMYNKQASWYIDENTTQP